MSNERRLILEMLAQGKISADDAERLLKKLDSSNGRPSNGSPAGEGAKGREKRPPKYLRILVNSTRGESVNIRVPLALVRTGIKLSTMMPHQVSHCLAEKGIDLSKLGNLEGEELLQAIQELAVDMDSGDGETVRIFCE